MASYCPRCKQEFSEAGGFCPYDGTPLVPVRRGGPAFVSIEDAPFATQALEPLELVGSGRVYDGLIGTTLDGRYQIERVLGEGGMGVVFLARHVIIEKLVAIKVLKRESAHDPSIARRFVQEAKAAARIGHPNIVDVTDFGTTPDGLTYSVMEYVEGKTLDKVIAEHAPMMPLRALPVVAQIAQALGAAHEKGIVHRDLKPDNVFVVERDNRRDFVKIVDFGIAKVTAIDGGTGGPRLTQVGTVFGTPEYMAPEQAAGRRDIDHRVDIYALGTILYQMLVGRVPHKGENTIRTLAMQMLDPIEPPRAVMPALGISDELERVMLKALAKKREERFQSMHELLRALEPVADGVSLTSPIEARAAASRNTTTGIGSERTAPVTHEVYRRWPLAAAALVLVAASAAAGTWVVRQRAGRASSAVSGDASIAAAGHEQPEPANPPREPDRATAAERPPTRPVEVKLLASPDHAQLYIDDVYTGSSGTNLRQPAGTKLIVECRADGHAPGRVEVTFGGESDVFSCSATRIKQCVAGLKNPFDDCPE